MMGGGPRILIAGGYGCMRGRLPRRVRAPAAGLLARAARHLMRRHSRVEKRKKLSTMLTAGEQQELCQVEQELRDTDRGFAWRMGLLQGMLRWAGPGRHAYLPVPAVLAAALPRIVTEL